MTPEEERDIERRLRSLALRPARPGLREKVLEAAAKHKKEAAWTTPRLRWCLAGCMAVLAVVFVIDAGLGRKQQSRLQALMDGSPRMHDRAADESRVLAEVLGEPVDRKLVARNERIASEEMRAGQVRREKVLRELLKEVFDGSEGAENNH